MVRVVVPTTLCFVKTREGLCVALSGGTKGGMSSYNSLKGERRQGEKKEREKKVGLKLGHPED